MQIIVRKGDDALFDKYLKKKSGQVSSQNKERKDKKSHVNSLYLDQSCEVENMTMPQTISPKSFYTQRVEQSHDQMSHRYDPSWRSTKD